MRGGGVALVGKRYNSHFMELPLLLQKFNEAGDLPMELHDHPIGNNNGKRKVVTMGIESSEEPPSCWQQVNAIKRKGI